jgi:hypothetical protein
MPLPENITIGKVFNRYGNEFESEKEIRDLSIQQRKRNLTIVGFVILGGVAGYLVGKRMSLKTWAKITTTVAGGIIFGASVSMLTQKKYNQREKAIFDKRQKLEQARYLTELAERSANKTKEKIKQETSNNED